MLRFGDQVQWISTGRTGIVKRFHLDRMDRVWVQMDGRCGEEILLEESDLLELDAPVPGRTGPELRAVLAASGWEVWQQEGAVWAARRGEGVFVRLRERSGRLQVVDAVGDAATIAAWILGAAALAGSTPRGSSTVGVNSGKDGGGDDAISDGGGDARRDGRLRWR